MADARVRHREHTSWSRWMLLVLWGAVLISAGGLLVGGDGSGAGPRALGPTLLVVAVGGIIHRFLGGLTVVLTSEAIRVGLGGGWPVRTRIPYEAIKSMESVRYRPLRDFGGWGRRSSGKRQAWTARGNEALVLHLVDLRQIYVGSDDPQRLEARIRSAAGTKLGGSEAHSS